MKTTLQHDGRLSLSKSLQKRLGWRQGTVVTLQVSGGRLIGEKSVQNDLVEKWRGKGILPKGMTVDRYLEKIRG